MEGVPLGEAEALGETVGVREAREERVTEEVEVRVREGKLERV